MSHTYTPTWEPYVIGATGLTAICRNLRVILTTLAFSVALDRSFAHYGRMIDSPAPQDAARLTVELMDAIERYEPRVKVESIEWKKRATTKDMQEGVFSPVISFSLKDGVKL